LLFNLVGHRCEDDDFLIVATTESADNALEIYGYRWEIETLFGCLKIRGFNLEDRLEKLMAVLAVAFCWAHKIGEWHERRQMPLQGLYGHLKILRIIGINLIDITVGCYQVSGLGNYYRC
jgi:hypothetical protein